MAKRKKRKTVLKQKQHVVQTVRVVVNHSQHHRRRRRRRKSNVGKLNREKFRRITERNMKEMKERMLAGLHRKRLVAAPHTLTTSEIMRISPYIAERLGQARFIAPPPQQVNPTTGRPEDSTPRHQVKAPAGTDRRRRRQPHSPSPTRPSPLAVAPAGSPVLPMTPELLASRGIHRTPGPTSARRTAGGGGARRTAGGGDAARTRLQERQRVRRKGSKQISPEPSYAGQQEQRRYRPSRRKDKRNPLG